MRAFGIFLFLWRSGFGEVVFLAQCFFDLVEDLFAFGAYFVVVVARGDVQQGSGFACFDAVGETGDIPSVFDVHIGIDLAVNFVVHHHIDHNAAEVHNGGEWSSFLFNMFVCSYREKESKWFEWKHDSRVETRKTRGASNV